jgi:hypothetical protein
VSSLEEMVVVDAGRDRGRGLEVVVAGGTASDPVYLESYRFFMFVHLAILC